MRRELLKETQPVAYEALSHGLKNHTVSHAYLFVGPKGTMKKEAALLFAQSLFCEHTQEGWACGECSVCKRIEEGSHMDFAFVDGSEKAISKKDVDDLQVRFSRTSQEEGTGQRCYILDHFENSSVAAMNSMLKFLEEPGKNVVAILTTDNLNRILPTIVSRCTMIPFTSMPVSYSVSRAIEEGVPEKDAWILCHVVREWTGLLEIYQKDTFQNALKMFREFLNVEGEKKDLLVDYDVSYKLSDRAGCMEMILYFLGCVEMYCHDVILHNENGPAWYVKKVKEETDVMKMARLLILVHTQKARCNKYNDPYLLMAQTYALLEEF